MKDSLQRFLFEQHAIRGELVHLDATWQAVLERHDYPSAVRHHLGEMMAAVMLLMATLKFKGRMIAQIQGNGPISLMVVEGSSDRSIRAIAHCNEEVTDGSLRSLIGDGNLVITLEQSNGERYQGIVALSGENIADALCDYLLRSEQLETQLWLAADGQSAAGLLIQKLPGESREVDAWNRIQQLSATISADELLNLDAPQIIHRLYHEEDVRVFESEPVCFRCSCNRDRVSNMLRMLGADELHAILQEQGSIKVACEFCNMKYEFDAVDTEQLLAAEIHMPAPEQQQ